MRQFVYFSFIAAVLAAGCRNSEQATGDAGPDVTIDAAPQIGCEALSPRAVTPEVIIGPGEWEDQIIPVIDSATDTLEVMMYQLSLNSFVQALVAAADRGAQVRVILDPDQTSNDSAVATLTAAGVQVKDAAASWENYHAKVVVADGDLAVVLSGNMNYFSAANERNYGVLLEDPEDIADLETIFEMDWAQTSVGYPSCTRLLLSPINSRSRLLAHINSATTALELAVMYLSDDQMFNAVVARKNAGVDVKVLLADPGWINGNTDTATALRAEGITVRFLRTSGLHAKLVLADGVAFVGSENFSFTSLEKNREVGVLVAEPGPAARIQNQFDVDWAAGTEQ